MLAGCKPGFVTRTGLSWENAVQRHGLAIPADAGTSCGVFENLQPVTTAEVIDLSSCFFVAWRCSSRWNYSRSLQ
jgi:hypothetical protein